MRECRVCNKHLPLTSFHRSGNRGYRTDCKDCRNNHRRQFRQENKHIFFEKENTPEFKAKSKAKSLKRNYGITSDQFDQLNTIQQGLCAICNKPENHKHKKHLSVDHNHKTGKVRGLLCHSCNVVLGLIKEDLGILESIKQYLKGE